jgi:hypothetical protein
MTEKKTKAEAAAEREQARADAAWLRRLAEAGEAKLDSASRRPTETSERPTSADRRAAQSQARTDAAWLRELAERGKADLERRKAAGETA